MHLYDFTVRALDDTPLPLRTFAGRVLLIVNVASRCGFTPQYAGLQQLWERYRDRGFTVLGFPCNQFGHQEPGTAAEIGAFCADRYGITFPLCARIDVNGAHADPVFTLLKAAAPGVLGSEAIKWNFTKFLVDRAGSVIRRYGSIETPAKIAADIEALL